MTNNPKQIFLSDVKVATPFLLLFLFTMVVRHQFPMQELDVFLQAIPSLSLGIFFGIVANAYARYRRSQASISNQ